MNILVCCLLLLDGREVKERGKLWYCTQVRHCLVVWVNFSNAISCDCVCVGSKAGMCVSKDLYVQLGFH